MGVAKKVQLTIEIEGKGTDKKSAFANALSSIPGEMLKKTSDVLLRIEPVDVTILQADALEGTEKFMFFFFPRKKVHYHVLLEVTVEVSSIVMEEVVFQVEKKSSVNPVSKWLVHSKINEKENRV